ncbi:prepilin peptidase [Candidatus Micrarchaeota archaeon]|nr:prepilin peptidase [Candidatus Micrarchaeota archaeon]
MDAFAFDAGVRVVVSVLVTAILAWEDHQTSFMNEKLLYAFAGAGLFWNLLFLDFNAFVFAFAVAAVIGVVGFVSYKTGQFGGGDVLLLLGLALWLPVSPLVAVPTPWPFVVSVFLVASFLATLGSGVWYAHALFKQGLFPGKKRAWWWLGVAALLLFGFLLPSSLTVKVLFVTVGFPAMFYLMYRSDVLSHAVIQEVSFKRLLDEDVLALEKLPQADVEKFGLERVLTASAKNKLEKFMDARKRKKVPVYKNLPRFGPYLLAGLLVSLVVGDVAWFLLSSV